MLILRESDIIKKLKLQDKEIDITQLVKKVWDEVIPQSYPFVEKFDTIKCSDVRKTEVLGGQFYMTKNFINYHVKVYINTKPLKDAGWKPDEKISEQLWKDVYGEDYFNNLKGEMVDLLGFVGVRKPDNFEFIGEIEAFTID